jgi:glucose-1-phosphatase
MKAPAPKLCIFDMGGVVSRNTNVFLAVSEHLGLPLERLREFAREPLARLITGKISGGEFWEILSKRSGLEIGEDLLARFFHPFQDQEVVELVKRLRGRCRVVVGTNTVESHYRIHMAQGDYEPFDAVYASHQMGLAKPDPGFYKHILRREACSAREAVFTDDLQENVRAAAALGIRAIHFCGAAELAKQIEELLFPGS